MLSRVCGQELGKARFWHIADSERMSARGRKAVIAAQLYATFAASDDRPNQLPAVAGLQGRPISVIMLSNIFV